MKITHPMAFQKVGIQLQTESGTVEEGKEKSKK
jgi:hypothetical protein